MGGEDVEVATGRAGAERLYLQVESRNRAAMALYRRAGFRHAYTYHYRVGLPARGGETP
jgi:ribosomal protein S18 acetylase RimI-like enzyme